MLSVEMKDDCSEIVHYRFEEYPIYFRKALLSSYEDYKAPAHWHDDIEFIAVLQGKMNYNVNGSVVTINEGEGIFVNSRQLHYGFSKSRNECEFICILIHPILLCVSQAFERDFVLPLLKNQNTAYIKFSTDIPWQKQTIKEMLIIGNAQSDLSAVPEISSSFLKIWSLIFANTKISSVRQVQSGDFTVLKSMIGFIQKSYKEKITLDDIAKSGAVGQSKCCKLFEKYIGTTPNEYLIKYRLHQSTWYLKNSDMTITQIANTVGFSGSSYYAEAFKKRYGKSPSKYRKKSI